MKKEATSKAAIEKLLSIVPDRRIVSTQSFFDNKKGSADKLSFAPAVEKDLVEEGVKSTVNYFKNQTEIPRFSFVSHRKKDGIVAGYSLFNSLKENDDVDAVLNPEINEKEISGHVKIKPLIKEAISRGYVDKKSVSLWKAIVSALVGLWSFFGIALKIDDIFELFDKKLKISGIFAFLGVFNIWIYIALLMIFIALVVLILYQKRKDKIKTIDEIDVKVNELSDEEFFDFIDSFAYEDFSLNLADSKKGCAFVCTLAHYSHRQKQILMEYLNGIASKEIWWIFAENTPANEPFVFEDSDDDKEVRFYKMKPLSAKEKRNIANETYNLNKIAVEEDAGININGADYVCRFLLKEKEPFENAEGLEEKIREFCSERSVSYQADIKLVIRLVAELSCNFSVDFLLRRNWEHLFDENQGDSGLVELDRKITAELYLDNRVFRNLVPEIVSAFSEDFADIVTLYPNSEQSSAYEQWCLVKALKACRDSSEERLYAITDILLLEFSSAAKYGEVKESLQSSQIWQDIIVKTAEIFFNKQYLWFLPTIIDNLIKIYGSKKDITLFSNPTVLEIAKANLLLNLNAEEELGIGSDIDVIKNHYDVITLAVEEKLPDFNIDNTLGYPSYMELLRLSRAERQRYINGLIVLKQLDVIKYYEYLYDIYSVSLKIYESHTKFCYSGLYNNNLYDKYVSGVASPKTSDYIKAIINKMLELFEELYGEKLTVIGSAIKILSDAVNQTEEDDIEQRFLYLIAKCDVIGAVSLNFLACLISRMEGNKKLPNDAFLNLGNYLVTMVFLTYYENTHSTYFNDEFIHLVRLITSYTEPDGAVLGFVFYCDTRYKSSASKERIQKYMASHYEKTVETLMQIVASLKAKDVEEFLCFYGFSSSVKPKEEIEIFTLLRQKMLTEYSTMEKSGIITEYLNLCIDKKASDEFLSVAPQENVRKFADFSSNFVYFMFYELKRNYFDEYYETMPIVVSKLLSSTAVAKQSLVAGYVYSSKNSGSEEYLEAARLFYESVAKKVDGASVNDLEYICYALNKLISLKKEEHERFEWLDENIVQGIFVTVKLEERKTLELQQKEYLNERTWGRYGILMYLRYLFNNATGAKKAIAEYESLDEEQKKEYIKANYQKITPSVRIDGELYYDLAYRDMLTAFINDGSFQKLLSEKDCLKKFVNETIQMISYLACNNKEYKTEQEALLNDYVSLLERN